MNIKEVFEKCNDGDFVKEIAEIENIELEVNK